MLHIRVPFSDFVKSDVPVSIKIGMACYGFIYHGSATTKTGEWQKVAVTNAYSELKK